VENKYKIYLGIEGQVYQIPVLPRENPLKHPTDHKTHDILSIGEVIVPRLPSLTELSLESYFPGDNKDSLLLGIPYITPERYISVLGKAWKNGTVIDVVINRYDVAGSAMYDTNVSAVITEFDATDKGGEAGDVYYKLKLKEYRNYAPVKVQIPPVQAAGRVQETEQRPVASNALYVGANVIANGKYYYTSYGDKPTGTANNLKTVVSRIINESSRPYPILIGGTRGWISRSQLQVIG